MSQTPNDLLDYHHGMLHDESRTTAYAEAIAATVRPGDVVLDIGTGTGILSLMALRAGAARVYAIEAGAIAQIARRVIADNDPEGRIRLVEGMSHDLTLPEPADVLVSEIIWNAGLGEGILATYADARQRLLKPDARVIPQRLEMWTAPVDSPLAHEIVSAWSPGLLGFDYASVRPQAANTTFPRYFRAESLIAPGQTIGAVDLTGSLEQTYFRGRATYAAARDGHVHGLCGWFVADLAPGVRLTNEPPIRSSWMQAYFPIAEPVPVRAGDPIGIDVAVLSNDELWQWTVDVAGRVQKGSTLVTRLSELEA